MSESGDFSDMQFVVLSGPSGSGKTTIVERLLHRSPVKLIKSMNAVAKIIRCTDARVEMDHILNVGGFSDAVISIVAAFLGDGAGRFAAEVDAVEL